MQRRHLIAALPAALAWTQLRAQSFPSRQIRYIVPVAAGGGSDLVGRTVTERWGRLLNQSFVVENIGGGGGAIACQTTAKAAPDGYTLLQGYVATHGTSPATRSKLPYDAIKDFTPVGMIGGTPNVLVVNASLPIQDMAQFIAYLRANPGRVSYGSAGQGSLTHLTMELLKDAAESVRRAHPVPRHRAGIQRPARRPDAGHVPGPGGRVAAHPLGPRAAAGRHRQCPASAAQGCADHGRVGFKGFDALQWYGVVGPADCRPGAEDSSTTRGHRARRPRPARAAVRRGRGALADVARARSAGSSAPT